MRDLQTLLRCILALIPKSEVEIINQIKSIKSSHFFSKEEDRPQFFIETANIILSLSTEKRNTYWACAVISIFTEEEFEKVCNRHLKY